MLAQNIITPRSHLKRKLEEFMNGTGSGAIESVLREVDDYAKNYAKNVWKLPESEMPPYEKAEKAAKEKEDEEEDEEDEEEKEKVTRRLGLRLCNLEFRRRQKSDGGLDWDWREFRTEFVEYFIWAIVANGGEGLKLKDLEALEENLKKDDVKRLESLRNNSSSYKNEFAISGSYEDVIDNAEKAMRESIGAAEAVRDAENMKNGKRKRIVDAVVTEEKEKEE